MLHRARRVVLTLVNLLPRAAWTRVSPTRSTSRSKTAVTLTGSVDWRYQKTNAENAPRLLHALQGIANSITVVPKAKPHEIKDLILGALRRNGEVEAGTIRVEVRDGGTVTLEGDVDNWTERAAVERAAWSASGVNKVVDHLAIA